MLGLGAMGSRVTARLLAAGHEVTVWNRSPARAAELRERGAMAYGDPAPAARAADVVLVCVRDDVASAAVWAAAEPGLDHPTTLVDLSTVSPSHAQATAAQLGPRFLAAPMVGSRPQVEAGQLQLLAGGAAATLAAARPVFAAIAGVVHHVGDAAAAARLKLVVNGLLAAQLAVAGELLDVLRTAEGDLASAVDLLAALPVSSPVLARSLPRALDVDVAPNFPLELVAKDLEYLIAEAGEAPVLAAVLDRVASRTPIDDIIALAA